MLCPVLMQPLLWPKLKSKELLLQLIKAGRMVGKSIHNKIIFELKIERFMVLKGRLKVVWVYSNDTRWGGSIQSILSEFADIGRGQK